MGLTESFVFWLLSLGAPLFFRFELDGLRVATFFFGPCGIFDRYERGLFFVVWLDAPLCWGDSGAFLLLLGILMVWVVTGLLLVILSSRSEIVLEVSNVFLFISIPFPFPVFSGPL